MLMKFDWYLVIPTCFKGKPFDKRIGGLSCCEDKSCVVALSLSRSLTDHFCYDEIMKNHARVSMPDLREALEASWDTATAYGGVSEAGNPALGQCYPTSR